jgi:hypothetical protein
LRILRLLLAVAALTACALAAPIPAFDPSTQPDPGPSTRKVDCSKRFDADDAAFQTCIDDTR